MSSKRIRVGGLAAVLGGVLLVFGDLVPLVAGVSSDAYTGTMPEKIASVLFLTGLVFILVALVGLYLHQAEAAGRFGLVAFLVTLVHPQERFRVVSYGKGHETSNLRPYAFKGRARTAQSRSALQRHFHPAPIPDASGEFQRR